LPRPPSPHLRFPARPAHIPHHPTSSSSQNQFDTIDLSDNAIARLDGFPRLPRARTLLAHGNRVAALGAGLGASLPALTTLGLAGNRLARLADLDPLASLPRLAHLVLAGNPVARHPQARPYLAWRCRALRSLDGARVTPAERAAGDAAFGGEAGVAAAATAGAERVKTFEPGEGRPEAAGGAGEEEEAEAAAPAPAPPTAEDLARVRAAIAAAATLDEVAALEAALARGDGAAALALAKAAGGEGGGGGGGGGGAAMEEG
jgi:U2 small nuclear ribonucleoprotein A'